MDTRVTQCPRCGTSFRVTDALLAVAAGAVRCGSCLHIFNAREHWLDDKAAEAKKTESTPTPIRPLNTKENANQERREPVIDDDALFDDDSPLFGDDGFGDEEGTEEDDQGRAIFNPASAEFTPAESEEKSIFGDLMDDTDWLTPNQISFGEEVSTDDETDADRWAEELLRDDPPLRATTSNSTDSTAASELSEADRSIQRLSIISDYQLEQDDILASVPETEEKHNNDEYIVLDLPSAYDPGLGRTPPPDEMADTDTESNSFNAGDRIGDETDTPSTARSRNTEPLRLHQFVRERRWPKALWGLGFVIVLALLPAQYLYFNFNNLARGELRPWLAQACDLVGCQLPPQSDPARIRTGSLIVRSHPTTRGALAVDAIITNLAPFAQPYPELVLQFTDINGGPVAGRRFKPAEYLGGELTGSHLMPIGQPIHVGLEVKDPGPRAVNYQLAVSPAQP